LNRATLLLEPAEDLARMGLLPTLWYYGLAERQYLLEQPKTCFSNASHQPKGELPNLVAIQSESFFDPRRWFTGVAPELLQQFDALNQTAASHGRLKVPAWGANTVRTEFAFLSGIANDQLGIHRFKPYRHLAYHVAPTLAGFLKKLGYRTVCIHPYSASFYDRNKIFPQIGFDEFIDISRFESADYVGQYVGDEAVARELCKELACHDSLETKPVFLFVITMENHGPLHLEQARSEDSKRYFTTSPQTGCDDLTVYLRHLENADQMLGLVRKQLESMKRGGWMCLYGDHLPIMPEVYRLLGFPDDTVDYLLWSNQKHGDGLSTPLRVEQLPVLLAQLMGLMSQQEACQQPSRGAALCPLNQ
jgi:phosphoglycerol transferase MdoB-like AlkP superfamily enzyme